MGWDRDNDRNRGSDRNRDMDMDTDRDMDWDRDAELVIFNHFLCRPWREYLIWPYLICFLCRP